MSRLIDEKRGQGMTEYIVILALVIAVLIAGWKFLGPKISGKFSDVAAQIK
jgi:Flp pilus assembly pilin Flp